MNLLSIQSHVAYGHVGNAAATFALQRLGVEVWPIHTVQFSNHTGYGHWRGEVFGSEHIGDVVRGLDERGVLSSCDGVLSGYMGSARIGEAILDAVDRVKAVNGNARYCCDPVMGDRDRGLFVRADIPEFLRARAVPAADVITPNQFELELLTGLTARTIEETATACGAVHAMGPATVLVTSMLLDETPADAIDLLVSGPDGRFRLRTPRLPLSVNGAGDLIAALFFHHLLRAGSVADALAKSTASVFGILRRTADTGAREIALVEAQDELVAPSHVFAAEPV